MLFSEILIHTTVGLLEKGLLFPREMLVCGLNLSYWFETSLPQASKWKKVYFYTRKILGEHDHWHCQNVSS